jgi:hypothetical protein
VTRSLRPWLLILPLTALGTLAAHELAYRLNGRAGDDLHGYLSHLPGICLLLLVLGLLGASFVERDSRLAAWPFPAVALLAYVGQEHAERLAHDGTLPFLAAEPVFLAGLLLQLPLAVVVWLAARVLLRVVGRRRSAAAPKRSPAATFASPHGAVLPALAVSPGRPRAPPASA